MKRDGIVNFSGPIKVNNYMILMLYMIVHLFGMRINVYFNILTKLLNQKLYSSEETKRFYKTYWLFIRCNYRELLIEIPYMLMYSN